MRTAYAIAEREIRSYFASPIGWIVLGAFMALVGWFFWAAIAYAGIGEMRMWFSNTTIVLIILLPALTMRLLAEERQRGTIEILMTSPVTDTQAVLGKFLGAWGFYCVMLLMTLQFPITLTRLATPDRGPFYSGYLGMALFGGTFIAVGLLISAMTKNQVVAYVGTLFVLLFLWLLSWAGSGDAWWQTLLTYISVPSHLDSFAKGMIDTRDVFFYLSFIGGMLFLTVRALAAWKWR